MNTSTRVGHYNKEPAASKAIPKIKAALAAGASTYEDIQRLAHVSSHSISNSMTDSEVYALYIKNRKEARLTWLRDIYDRVNKLRDKGLTLQVAVKRVGTNNTSYYKAQEEFGKWGKK